ncbi:hypothetical protein AMS68_005871 [Peltaster fructicola]|uniref:Ribosomal protein L7/L12 C-terminal domain-containing protein n=1 Tax=Peltaster fructicola TaxID=286661 RepID=A0A6H0Y031_9PEZI|nr:hypothetical protein AMS68_005871 [Peltaster fructicola]
MSTPCTCLARQSIRSIRTQSTRSSYTTTLLRQKRREARRWQSTDAVAASNPKIAGIVDQISTLTLLETADLVSTLKSRLNIPDIPMGGFAAAGPAQAAAPAAEEPEEVAPKVEEKTLFNVKLESFDAASKAKIIKEVKGLLGLSLVDSKKFVESVPKVMKEAVPKEEAEKMIETMKTLGAVAKME